MTRPVRRACALVALCVLVFAQLAVSAYACPAERGQEIAAAANGGEPYCDDPGNPNLCDRHCAYGSSATGQPTLAIPSPWAGAPLPWRIVQAAPALTGARALDDATLRFESPPPLILFGVIRV